MKEVYFAAYQVWAASFLTVVNLFSALQARKVLNIVLGTVELERKRDNCRTSLCNSVINPEMYWHPMDADVSKLKAVSQFPFPASSACAP